MIWFCPTVAHDQLLNTLSLQGGCWNSFRSFMFLGQVSLVRDGGRGVAAESLDVKNGKEEPVFHRFCKIQHNPDEQGETAQERLRSNQPCGVVWSLALALKRFFSSAFRKPCAFARGQAWSCLPKLKWTTTANSAHQGLSERTIRNIIDGQSWTLSWEPANWRISSFTAIERPRTTWTH